MKLVIQRVTGASVSVKKKAVADIGKGMLVLVGIGREDNEETIKECAQKILRLRIFSDSNNKMNCSIKEVKGDILAVPQFTLLADTSNGNRPSFIKAADPAPAEKLFDLFVKELKTSRLVVETGIFREYMEVGLINDGPITIIYE